MRLSLSVLLFVAFLSGASTRAAAQSTLALRCAPVSEMAGRPVKTLIAEHVKDSLIRRGWQHVTVKVENIKQSESSEGIQQMRAIRSLTSDVTLSVRGGGRLSAGIRGSVGGAAGGALHCSISIGESTIYVSGSYPTQDGVMTKVRGVRVDVSDLYVPGIRVPVITQASAPPTGPF